MKKLTIIFVLLGLLSAYGQHTSIYSEYMFNQILINPALAGNNQSLNCSALYRNQWVGIDEAPQTATFTIDVPLKSQKLGLGMNFTHDQIGVFANSNLAFNYAYHIQFGKSKLSMGLQGGASNINANYSLLKYSRENDYIDPAFSSNESTFNPIFGAGGYFQTNNFYIGLSMPNLIWGNTQMFGYSQKKIAYISSGYVFELSKNLMIKPSILLRMASGASMNFDLNANIWIKKVVAFGVSYRYKDSFISLIEVKLNNNFRLGFSHDYNISSLAKFNKGSNEIMLKYQFNIEKCKYLTMQF